MSNSKKKQVKPTRVKARIATADAKDKPSSPTTAKASMATQQRAEHLAHALEHAAHHLPTQSPISLFVHHNTLHAFQHLPFHEAVVTAGQLLNANAYISMERFRALYERARITDEDIALALDMHDAKNEEDPAAPVLAKLGLKLRELQHIWLTRPIEPTTALSLPWMLQEEGLLERLPKPLTAQDAAKRLEGIQPRFDKWLDAEPTTWLTALTGASDASGAQRFAARFERAATSASLQALTKTAPLKLALAALWEHIAKRCDQPQTPPTQAALLVESQRKQALSAVCSLLSSMSALFMDEGQAHWSMPSREQGFFHAVLELILHRGGAHLAWLKNNASLIKAHAKQDAQTTTLELLKSIPHDALEHTVEQTLQLLPGWAGMFARLEQFPQERRTHQFPVSLSDYLATALLLLEAARHHYTPSLSLKAMLEPSRHDADHKHEEALTLHEDGLALFLTILYSGLPIEQALRFTPEQLKALALANRRFDVLTRQRLMQEALELRYEDEVLSALYAQHTTQPLSLPRQQRPSFQATFCIDDREESYRRIMEEIAPTCETFGAAGFFGLAIAYQGIDEPTPSDLCPVGVVPKHEIKELPIEEHAHLASARTARRKLWSKLDLLMDDASRGYISGSALSLAAGPIGALAMATRIVSPHAASNLKRWVHQRAFPTPTTRLTIAAEASDAAHGPSTPQLSLGYSLAERVERAQLFFENIGLLKDHARIFVVAGHGSTSQNNPHRAAYDCGACSGKHGGPNARLMAAICNDPQVREGLKAKHIHIPEDTWFIGAFHNTCDDAMDWFDLDLVPQTHRDELEQVIATFQKTSELNALERCRRFASAQHIRTPKAALKHVQARSQHLSEPRPELGHATNALCVVGRRALTRGLFLDRRGFLVCYDPSIDDTGKILERLLAAAGPVGAGINLEYYFSHVDNERYGCGTKLPHNMTGLLGVINGTSGDLRPGLPWQMVEIHEPLRLLLVVESTPQRLLEIAGRQPVVAQLVTGGWIKLASIDPTTHQVHVFRQGGFIPWTPQAQETLPQAPHSADWFKGNMESLPIATITSALYNHKV